MQYKMANYGIDVWKYNSLQMFNHSEHETSGCQQTAIIYHIQHRDTPWNPLLTSDASN